MSDEEIRLKLLQKRCARSLVLYIDLSEAVCEMLVRCGSAPITPADRLCLRELRREEVAALKKYLRARLELMNALSITCSPEYRRMLTAVSAGSTHRRARA